MTSSRMKRRSFTAATAAAFASIAVVRAPARAAQFQYKCGSDLSLGDAVNVRAVQMWDAVEKESGGRLSVRNFPDNQLGSILAQLSQVRSGAQEFMFNSGAQFPMVPVAMIENTGYAFRSMAEGLAAMDGPLGAYIRKEIEAAGIVVMPHIWGNGMRQVTNSVHPVNVPADLEGLKLRMPPSKIFIDMFRAFGAATTPLNFNELYSAMQTKLVDGAELPLSAMEGMHVAEVQKYLSMTNHIWAGKWLIANKDAWNALPKDIQAIVVRNSDKYGALERRDYAVQDAALRDKIVREGMKINFPNPEPFRAKLGPYYAYWKSQFGSAWDLLEASVGKLG